VHTWKKNKEAAGNDDDDDVDNGVDLGVDHVPHRSYTRYSHRDEETVNRGMGYGDGPKFLQPMMVSAKQINGRSKLSFYLFQWYTTEKNEISNSF